jgi:short-subunit dehydrogenase
MNRATTSASSSVAKTVLVAVGAAYLAQRFARRRRRTGLDGKIVLITGGSRGLGLALAREFAGQGCRIGIAARDPVELAIAADELGRSGGHVKTFSCDLTSAAEATELVERVNAAFGRIDVLVNNAGTIIVGPAEQMSADDFEKAMDLNFWAAVHTTLAVAPLMKRNGGGRIVNIASIGGKIPVPHLAPYCASKFALVGFSGGMRTELAHDGIKVTTVCPGLMRTGSPRNAQFKGNHQAEYAWFSISDSLPGLSMDAQTAARKIVDATIHGDGEVVLGLPAKVATSIYAIAPNAVGAVSAAINWFLPRPRSGGQNTQPGRDSESALSRIGVTGIGRLAEKNYNQLNT